MNDNFGKRGNTLPFSRPARASRRGAGAIAAEAAGQDWEDWLDLIRQQPEIDISKTISLCSGVNAGRYQPDAARIAKRMLQFEARLQGDQDSGGRSS